MAARLDVQQVTLALMVLKTLDILGPLHGYGIARRIEETSLDRLINSGTRCPALLKLEQWGCIRGEWDVSDGKRRTKTYTLTRAGRRQLPRETRHWQPTSAILAGFLTRSRSPA